MPTGIGLLYLHGVVPVKYNKPFDRIRIKGGSCLEAFYHLYSNKIGTIYSDSQRRYVQIHIIVWKSVKINVIALVNYYVGLFMHSEL